MQQDDRRAASLGLTSKGKNIIRKYEALQEEKLGEVLDSFSPEELDALMQGLEKASHLILEKELDQGDICMKCNAYYVEHCTLRSLRDGCIYVQNQKHVTQ